MDFLKYTSNIKAGLFLLGFFLDYIEIIFVIIPLVGPGLIANGADPLWLGILISLNLQTSFLTPPFGFSLFFLRGVAAKEVKTINIYKGVILEIKLNQNININALLFENNTLNCTLN